MSMHCRLKQESKKNQGAKINRMCKKRQECAEIIFSLFVVAAIEKVNEVVKFLCIFVYCESFIIGNNLALLFFRFMK